jgi:hypothetical protein
MEMNKALCGKESEEHLKYTAPETSTSLNMSAKDTPDQISCQVLKIYINSFI